jgi:hypothetical protein
VNWLSFPMALLLFALLTMASTLAARRYLPAFGSRDGP